MQLTVPKSPRYQLCFQYIVLKYVTPQNITKNTCGLSILKINSRAPTGDVDVDV